ncbi:MAG: LytTR family transcriptional regulator [Paludibacteraceae bacterium]|nr:LytTR family transcriptional regulator [Paludibacteraceae bacterium]
MQLIGVAIVLIFVSLVFTPVFIYEWVEQNRLWLMWAEISLLLVEIGLLWNNVHLLNHKINMLQTEEAVENSLHHDRYHFYDEKGDLRLVVDAANLYYLESADNYVMIHYMHLGKMEKMMIRNTLKNIEWRFRGKGLVRCHRSYLVNIRNVQLFRRSEGEILLDFGNEKIQPIPAGKSYQENVLAHFSA